MSDETTKAIVPDYLLDALNSLAEISAAADDVSQVTDVPRLRLTRVEIPQRTSSRFENMGGMIVRINPNGEEEVVTSQYMDLILVDILSIRPSNVPSSMPKEYHQFLPTAPRTMWQFNPDGSRTQTAGEPSCGSPNGIAPWAKNLGKPIFDHRTGQTHVIGSNGAHACMGCPFAAWTKDRKAPLCGMTTPYVFYDVDRDELFMMMATNRSLQIALNGDRKVTYANGRPSTGAAYPFQQIGTGENGQPIYRNRPQGYPTVDNPTAPIYAVRMTVTQNSFTPPAYVPQFDVLDGSVNQISHFGGSPRMKMDNMMDVEPRKLTDEEIARYSTTLAWYYREGIRDNLLYLDRVTFISVPDSDVSLLESGTPPWTDGEYQES